ncbi:family 10 glycosylhydrolase, partial [bacterium]|nr:family 10 glycosylhydrolase [bacterium]
EQAPKYEFRAAWIATVLRLDWPKSSTVSIQKSQLISILDGMQKANMNAAIFQIRPVCDAFYASEIEPWSNWLTGTEGQAPNPYYDPLVFAIEEAHKRGIELHAWFNPYRAKKGSSDGTSADHVFNKHPEWILAVGSKTSADNIYYALDEQETEDRKATDYILNPGMAVVREYVLSVVMDVVNRYDIDGVHMDDYFYPYSGINNEDQATFAAENRGFTDIGDWRRDNVNLLIESIYDSIKAVKPNVKFGMSPFGIWKSGVPSGIVGTSSYSAIYCDPVAWLDGQYIDYLTPQLYWPFEGGQDYGLLMPWWADQAKINSRHLYTGNAPYRITDELHNWDADELPHQIQLNRNTEGCYGNVYFRVTLGVLDNPKGFLDSLKTNYYKYPALTPQMSWIDSIPPIDPTWVDVAESDGKAIIRWGHDLPTKSDDEPYRYIIYKWPDSDLTDITNPEYIYTITTPSDPDSVTDGNYSGYIYGVAALDRLNNESNVVTSTGLAIQPSEKLPEGFHLFQNFPNPFNPSTTIVFDVPKDDFITLSIYNLRGQLLETLVDEFKTTGRHTVEWNAGQMNSGVYLYKLQSSGMTIVKKCILMK